MSGYYSGRLPPPRRKSEPEPVQKVPRRYKGGVWCILTDCCGIACAVITYVVTIGTCMLANTCCLLPLVDGPFTLVHVILYNLNIVALIVSQVRCMCTNPGTARDHLDQELQRWMGEEFERIKNGGPGLVPQQGHRKWWCTRCDTFRPKHTHHCSTCGVCVLEMDHHCPWVNNCVGWRNHKYFLLFLFHALIGCSWSILVFMYALVMPSPRSSKARSGKGGRGEGEPLVLENSAAARLIQELNAEAPRRFNYFEQWASALHTNLWLQLGCVFCCVACFMLSLFATVMVCDQWEFMARGFGVIDKKLMEKQAPELRNLFLKGLEDPNPTTLERVMEARINGSTTTGAASRSRASRWGCQKLPQIMGGPPNWRWLMPTAAGDMTIAEPGEDPFIQAVRKQYGPTSSSAASSSSGNVGSAEVGTLRNRRQTCVVDDADMSQATELASAKVFQLDSEGNDPGLRGRKAALAQQTADGDERPLRGRQAALVALSSLDAGLQPLSGIVGFGGAQPAGLPREAARDPRLPNKFDSPQSSARKATSFSRGISMSSEDSDSGFSSDSG